MNPNEVNDVLAGFPEVNAVVLGLLKDVRHVLEGNLTGMYLEGSLANGGFDQDSDIDFVVVMDREIDDHAFSALQALHERINLLDTQWSTNLEGSYVSKHAVRRHHPGHTKFPNIERGFGERLKMVHTDATWNVHRHILRARGITLFGPAPMTLIDPIPPDELRQAMLPALHDWAAKILDHPNEIAHQGYQSYTVLSLCRILYTLEFGDIVSKRQAAAWVKETQAGPWNDLIDKAWVGRHNPQWPASPEDVKQTLDLIKYGLGKAVSVSPPG